MSHPRQLLLGDGVEHLRTLPARRDGDDEHELAEDAAAAARIRAAAARVVTLVGPKQAADELGTQVSALSHMLAARGPRYLRLDWAPWFDRNAPDDEFAGSLVARGGRVVIPAPLVTAEDELAAARDVAAEMLSPEFAALHRERTRLRALEYARRRSGGGR